MIAYKGGDAHSEAKAGCEDYFRPFTPAYNGGPGALLLYWQIEALSGRGLESLVGAYRGVHFEIP